MVGRGSCKQLGRVVTLVMLTHCLLSRPANFASLVPCALCFAVDTVTLLPFLVQCRWCQSLVAAPAATLVAAAAMALRLLPLQALLNLMAKAVPVPLLSRWPPKVGLLGQLIKMLSEGSFGNHLDAMHRACVTVS